MVSLMPLLESHFAGLINVFFDFTGYWLERHCQQSMRWRWWPPKAPLTYCPPSESPCGWRLETAPLYLKIVCLYNTASGKNMHVDAYVIGFEQVLSRSPSDTLACAFPAECPSSCYWPVHNLFSFVFHSFVRCICEFLRVPH